MSKTFTSRPAVTQGRGRGRGTQTRQTSTVRGTGMDSEARPRVGPPHSQTPGIRNQPQGAEALEQDQQEIGQRMSYEGGYTKITPNMKKRQQINDMAAREAESYEAHKQQNTPKSFSYVGTAGGGQMTEGAARQKLINNTPNKTQRLLQNQTRKSFVKQKEEEELQMKKQEQRQKSLQNEKKKKQEEEATAHKWDEQRKKANDALLNRIEAANKRATKASSQTKSSPVTQTSQDESSMSPRRLQPEGASAPREIKRETKEACSASNESSGNNELTSEQNRALVAVSAVCPHYPRETLIEILQQVDFSVDSAIMLLTE